MYVIASEAKQSRFSGFDGNIPDGPSQ